MKVSELKSWIWGTVLETNPKIPLDAQVVLDVEGAYIYTVDTEFNLVKKDNEEMAEVETATVKQLLDAADAHADKELDAGHEFTGSWIYARRSFGNVLWITLVPNDGEVPEEAAEPTAEAEPAPAE